jgi:hypothetical protein
MRLFSLALGVCAISNKSGHKANKCPEKRLEAPTRKVKEAEEDGFKESATTEEVHVMEILHLKGIMGVCVPERTFACLRAAKVLSQLGRPMSLLRVGRLGLVLWILWVDDCLIAGSESVVKKEREKMKQLFDCDDVGKLQEYVGCKIVHDRAKQSVKMTQPVLLKSLTDKFVLGSTHHETPATAGEVLRKGNEKDFVSSENMSKYQSGTGKLFHLTKWSRPGMS